MEDDTEDTEHDEKENGTKNGNGHFAQSLVLSLVNKTLEDRKQRNEHGMSREEQVVYHHLGLSGNNRGTGTCWWYISSYSRRISGM